ncbi:MAG: sodium-dependent transporter [Candidatus Latescibacteria bacterium]|nr:sodium-dependent transporter [Candidatus Latescibacterota bacterium]
MESTPSQPRDTWGSKLTFILAAAGSAIGLGNIWAFPTNTAANGGAAFVLVYLICVIFIGAPVMLAEFTIGRSARRNPVGAFKMLAPGTSWKILGGLGVATGVIILSFYAVIAGWTVAYILKCMVGTFKPGVDTLAIFEGMSGNPLSAIGYLLVFMALSVYVVVGGVRDGIERWTKVLMPILLILLVLLGIRAVTLSGAKEGLAFYLKPDFSLINLKVVLAAAGQAFFSLSLGMGTMITYGSYIAKRDNLVSSTLWVGGLDTAIAILAGLIIFPTLFHAGLGLQEGGPGMVFVVLTSLLGEMPPAPIGGIIFGTGFFLLLGIAAITSSVSLLEVGVAYIVDEKRISRKKAGLMLGGMAFVLGIPSALGNGAVSWLTDLPGIGKDFLSFLFVVFGQYSLAIGAMLISIFVGWKWGVKAASAEVESEGNVFRFRRIWSFLVRFLCPITLAVILINMLWGVITG